MTLTDAGPLVALIDGSDPHHTKCLEATKQFPKEPLLTTWPCFTEAMYLLDRNLGHAGQASLWQLYQAGRLVLLELSAGEIVRMIILMEKYRDTPMDLADASLIVAAERFGMKRVFTLDGDFLVYRLADGSALEVAP
ncbi:MAG: PIN domain-containing protein [Planctomycetes bacterium]|nr:PIN domain-containing protein [Planctomycetota bacterium]